MAPLSYEIGSQARSSGNSNTSKHWLMGQEAFKARMPHHESIKALWETKWKFACEKAVYPFHDGAYEDFEPVFKELIENNISDPYHPQYALPFFTAAQRLCLEAETALRQRGDKDLASSLYLRACALYRISRFPYLSSLPRGTDLTSKVVAFETQKKVYRYVGNLWESPLEEVEVDFKHRKQREGQFIPIYVRIPVDKNGDKRLWPAVILLTGLDGYRPDNTQRCNEFLKRGWAAIVVEIPGTADCPADRADPEAPDRLWTSLLDWMAEDGRFNMKKVMVWGLSSGGYYAIRIAHTHKDQLIGCVAQGAGCHYFFDPEWLEKIDGHEYPFKLLPSLAVKYGFDSVEEFKTKAQKKFSLLETGILDKPSTRLLLVNGMLDGLTPIEDSMLLFEHGSPKEGRFFPGALHMGYPKANESVYPWMESVMNSIKD